LFENEQKSFRPEGFEWRAADDAPEGAFTATFSTLNTVDHHGDVTLPGAFENGRPVLVGAYQHSMGSLPVGRGVLRADEGKAWVEGQFWLDTTGGADTYATVKNSADLMEWSYIFTVEKADFGPFETENGAVDVRFLRKLDVWSIDPVLRGAGIGTGTTSIKSFSNGLTFIDHAAGIADAVEDFVTRAKGRLDYRLKEGRQLSTANVERLSSIAESLRSSASSLDQLLTDSTPQKSHGIELEREWMRFQQTLARANGLLAD
jgi:hypothetical protein